MTTTLIQARIDSDLKDEATELFASLGLDMPTAIKIYLRKCVTEGGIPFAIRTSVKTPKSPAGWQAFQALQREAAENGLTGMTTDEIDAEIAAARAEHSKQVAQNG